MCVYIYIYIYILIGGTNGDFTEGPQIPYNAAIRLVERAHVATVCHRLQHFATCCYGCRMLHTCSHESCPNRHLIIYIYIYICRERERERDRDWYLVS